LPDLTGHWVGFAALAIFAAAYALVIAEEATRLRKSKPVVVAAGLLWVMVGLVYVRLGLSDALEAALRRVFLEYAELLLFLLVAMTYVNALEERRVFDVLRDRGRRQPVVDRFGRGGGADGAGARHLHLHGASALEPSGGRRLRCRDRSPHDPEPGHVLSGGPRRFGAPAKAGTHCTAVHASDEWVPAFAGAPIWVGGAAPHPHPNPPPAGEGVVRALS
jgi:hypothetical protein